MDPSECRKCRDLFAADDMAQIKMQAEAMRIVADYATVYVNERYALKHRELLHESKLDPPPRRTLIKP